MNTMALFSRKTKTKTDQEAQESQPDIDAEKAKIYRWAQEAESAAERLMKEARRLMEETKNGN